MNFGNKCKNLVSINNQKTLFEVVQEFFNPYSTQREFNNIVFFRILSEKQDSNLRPHRPERCALPS